MGQEVRRRRDLAAERLSERPDRRAEAVAASLAADSPPLPVRWAMSSQADSRHTRTIGLETFCDSARRTANTPAISSQSPSSRSVPVRFCSDMVTPF